MQCECTKKLVATAAVFAFKMLSGMTLCGGIFNWVYRLPPTDVWRPMCGPGRRIFAGMFLASFLFVVVYTFLSKAFEGMSPVKKGLLYGLCVWAAGIVPGMIATYSFMTVNTTVVVYWTLLGLVLTPIQGIIVALIIKDQTAQCCVGKK